MELMIVISVLFAVQFSKAQNDYDGSCKTAIGEVGVCMPSSECGLTDSELMSCGSSGFICCNKHHTSTISNHLNQDLTKKKNSNRRDEADFNSSSEKVNSPTEDPSSEPNPEDSSVENRFRWPSWYKSTRHSFYSSYNWYGPHRDSVNGYYPTRYKPSYNTPSLYHPSYNKPTENSITNQHFSQSFDREKTNEWHLKPTPSEPVWGVDSPEETETTGPRRKRISQIKCEEYSRPVTETVRAIPLSLDADVVPLTVQKCQLNAAKLIVGGVAAEVGEYPHMAAVGFLAGDGSIMWNCGGSLISEQYVMTAGHCTNTTFGNPVVVRLGELDLATTNDDANPKDYKVDQVIPHPRYITSVKYNDIALLRLEKPVTLSEKIRPACLSSLESVTNKPVATGWGRTDFVGRTSDQLMKVGLSIIDNHQCNEFYKKDRTIFFKQGITDSMLCAGELQGGKDTCFGDSGGPLQITDEGNSCIYHIIGVTSFGKVCGAANSPGVYTRVCKFLPWIEKTVWG